MEEEIRQITSFSTFPSARPKTMIFSAGHDKQVTELCQGGGKKRDKSSTLLRKLLAPLLHNTAHKHKDHSDQEREEMGAFGQTLK